MSGIGEWTIQLEDSCKHSQQHCSSRRSTDDSSRVIREGNRKATRESRAVSIRGRKVSFSIVRSAARALKMSEQRVLCVESPSEERSSSSARIEEKAVKASKERWMEEVATLSRLCIWQHTVTLSTTDGIEQLTYTSQPLPLPCRRCPNAPQIRLEELRSIS